MLGAVSVAADVLKAIVVVLIAAAARDGRRTFVVVGSLAFVLFSLASLVAATRFCRPKSRRGHGWPRGHATRTELTRVERELSAKSSASCHGCRNTDPRPSSRRHLPGTRSIRAGVLLADAARPSHRHCGSYLGQYPSVVRSWRWRWREPGAWRAKCFACASGSGACRKRRQPDCRSAGPAPGRSAASQQGHGAAAPDGAAGAGGGGRVRARHLSGDRARKLGPNASGAIHVRAGAAAERARYAHGG